jgi:hypothetical protein
VQASVHGTESVGQDAGELARFKLLCLQVNRLSGDAVAIKIIAKSDLYDHRQRPGVHSEYRIACRLWRCVAPLPQGSHMTYVCM